MQKYKKCSNKLKISFISIFIISIAILIVDTKNIFPIDDFGSNKPHLIYHVGQRDRISMNVGWGYWQNQKQSSSQLRAWYQNTQNGLYVDMKSHNGKDHFEQYVQDRKYKINSNLKYQLIKKTQDLKNNTNNTQKIQKQSKNHWESKIQMQNQGQNQFTTYSSFWIENTDDSLIDFKGYSTPKAFQLQIVNNKHAKVKYFNSMDIKTHKTFNIYSKGEQELKVFGLAGNISETYNSLRIVREFKDILQIQKYPSTQRDNNTKRVEWQNGQVQLIQSNNWKGKKFIFVFVYCSSKESVHIEITNGTNKSFDDKYFEQTKSQLKKKYFGDHQKGQFLRHIIFNLLGGIAYYQGKLYTQNSLMIQDHSYSYGMTPSRLIFPRSFLWDDGFHMMVIVDLQPLLVLKFLQNWMNKIDALGWIGRQQIRGFQMAFLMPDVTFVYQDSFEMNPPTLFFVIQYMLEKNIQKQNLLKLLNKNFAKLQRWYRYFRKTQSHFNLAFEQQIEKTPSYRWRCKDQCKKGNFMGSGLDDYPRTQNSDQISKKHVDIISWISYFTKQLSVISSQILKSTNDSHKIMSFSYKKDYYQKQHQNLNKMLLNQYVDPNSNLFKDIAVAAEQIYIDQFVSHNGYITLFPFMLQRVPITNSSLFHNVIKNTLKLMLDQNELLSQDGIRSLSKSDSLYGTDDNYWRGPVWMPIQYLILNACQKYYFKLQQFEHQLSLQSIEESQKIKQNKQSLAQVYKKVRERVISTVQRNYQETGYLFENYHKGKGNRGHPFYGWTSIIANIITMKSELN